jgi:hypothetical protein
LCLDPSEAGRLYAYPSVFDELAQVIIDYCEAKDRESRKRVRFAVADLQEFFVDALAVDVTRDRVKFYMTYRARKSRGSAHKPGTSDA